MDLMGYVGYERGRNLEASQEDRGVIYCGRSREGVAPELGVGHTGLESPVKQPRGEVKKADWQLRGF